MCLYSKYPKDAMYFCHLHGIAYKQMRYYLKKWCIKGFWNWGTAAESGWFEFEHMPSQYKEIVNYLMMQH